MISICDKAERQSEGISPWTDVPLTCGWPGGRWRV